MRINELIRSYETDLDNEKRARDRVTAEVRSMLDQAKREGRSNLTPIEDQRTQQLLKQRDRHTDTIRELDTKLGEARTARDEETQMFSDQANTRSTGASLPAYDHAARVGAEARTYHRGNDRKGAQFLRDIAKQFLYNDVEAQQRLSTHMREERVERGQYLERSVGTGAFTGLTVPAYLTSLYAPAIAAGRPFADICTKHDLPEQGMTVNISKISTPSAVANQGSQNTAVAEQNMADTLLTFNVQTAAGQETLSRQAIDRGTGIEEVTMQDLLKRYATNLDNTLLNQASTGLSATAGTAASVTAATFGGSGGFYPNVLAGAAASEAALLAQATPDHVVMHSRRWHWLSNILTNTWPAINQPRLQPYNAGSSDGAPYSRGIRGTLPNGMYVCVDNNVTTSAGTATNQDEVYVVAADECHLWEDPDAPVFIRAEQPAAASLGVLLVAYGYFAFTTSRYTGGQQKLSGAGLATPVFQGA